MLETNSIAPSGQGVKPSPVQMLRVKKLNGSNIIKNATSHNLREIQAELGADSHIDPLKTPNNVILRGESTAQAVQQQAMVLMGQGDGLALKKLRCNTVLGIEVLVSLPPASGIPERKFFEASVAWAVGFFEVPILSAVIHNDEGAPHCHIILLPLFDGRMIGSGLVGYKQRLVAMQADFFDKVGMVFGLSKPVRRMFYSRVARQKMAGMIVDYLKQNPRYLELPAVRDALRDTFIENPLLMMTALNLTVPEILRERTAANAGREAVNPQIKSDSLSIGNESREARKELSLSCVGNAICDASNQAMPTAVNHPVTNMIRQVIEPVEEIASEYTREHEDDVRSRYWCEELGEYITIPKTRNRQSGIEPMRE